MDCNDIGQPILLVNYFRQDDEPTKSGVLKCFYKLYFETFKRLTFSICLNKPYTEHKGETLAREAFNDGLLSFYFFVREKGFADRGASVKSLFFTFCIKKLKGLITDIARQSVKKTGGNPEIVIAKVSETKEDDYQVSNDYEEQWKKNETLLNKALEILGERGKRLIYWRKVDKLGNEEIATLLNIQPGSVNNEVYKCLKRLNKIVDDLKKGN